MKHYESLIIGHITMDHDTDYLGNETLATSFNDKVAFTFNNLSFANLSQKAEELKEVLGTDEQLWKWVAQYLVMKRLFFLFLTRRSHFQNSQKPEYKNISLRNKQKKCRKKCTYYIFNSN